MEKRLFLVARAATPTKPAGFFSYVLPYGRTAMFLFCFFFATFGWGQNNSISIDMPPHYVNYSTYDSTYHEPALIVDNVGTVYRPSDVKYRRDETVTCYGQNFDVSFVYTDPNGTGFNGANSATLQNLLCAVMQDISYLIVPPADFCSETNSKPNLIIRVESVVDPSIGSLAYATPLYYNFNENLEGFAYNSVWKYLTAGTDPISFMPYNGGSDAAFAHGILTFNFAYPFYYGATGNPNNAQYDFYSVALHEMLHLMGFYSLIHSDGLGSVWGNNLYTKYDSFLHLNNTTSLLNNDGCYDVAFNNNCLSNLTQQSCQNIFFDGNAGTPADLLPIWSPLFFADGTSLSHLNGTCSPFTVPYFIMHPNLAMGHKVRYPSQEEVSILCHLGYQTSTVYGNGGNAHQYTSPACGSIISAVDDPCNTPYIDYCDGVPLTINIADIIANDHNVVSVSCVEVETGNGTIVNVTNNAILFESNNDYGLHLLSYIGLDANGNESNPALIYIMAESCNCFNCSLPNTACNLICNPAMYDPNVVIDYGNVSTNGVNVFEDFPNFIGWNEIVSNCDYLEQGDISPGSLRIKFGYYLGYNTETASEVLTTCAPISEGKDYIVAYVGYVPDGNPINNIYFALGNYSQLLSLNYSGAVPANSIPFFPTDQVIITDQGSVNSHETISCFTANQNYDALYIWGEGGQVQEHRYAIFDHIELIEDNFPDNQTFSSECGGSIEFGDDTCLDNDQILLDFDYSWEYSTDDGTTWQVLLDDNGMPITTATHIVEPTVTTQYKLTRSFGITNTSYPIFGTACVEKEAIFTVNIPIDINCCFQNTLDIFLQFNPSTNAVVPFGTAGATSNFTAPATGSITWTNGVGNHPFGNATGAAGNPIRLNGDLIIPPGAKITMTNLYFEFGTQGRVIVQKGAVLVINGCLLTSNSQCPTMWQGIQVWGAGNSNTGFPTIQTNTNTGRLFIINPAAGPATRIKNAIIGIATTKLPLFDMNTIVANLQEQTDINANNLTTSSFTILPNLSSNAALQNGGGYVYIAKYKPTRFENCFYGVYIGKQLGQHAPTFNDDISTIFGNDVNVATAAVKHYSLSHCEYSSDASLLHPFSGFRSEAGLVTHNIKTPIYVNDCSYQNLVYGVRSHNTRYLVQEFSDFISCSVGVSARSLSSPFESNIIVTNNNIVNANIGMQGDAINTFVSNNTIIGAGATTGDNLYNVGVLLRSCFYKVGGNNDQYTPFNDGEIYTLSTNTISNFDVGILPIDTDDEGAEIEHNIISNTLIGIYAIRMNTGLQISCNQIQYQQKGIALGGWNGTQGVLANQGNCAFNKVARNTFDPLPGAEEALWYDPATAVPFQYSDISSYVNTFLATNSNIGANNLFGCTFNFDCSSGNKPLIELGTLGTLTEKEKNYEASRWLREFQKTDDYTEALPLLEALQTRMASRKLVQQYYELQNLASANIKLESIKRNSEEDENFYALQKILIQLKENYKELSEMNDEEANQLLAIAATGTPSAYRAQAVLYEARGYEFPLILPPLPNGDVYGATVFKTTPANTKPAEQNQIGVFYPNPAQNEMLLDYQLLPQQQAKLSLYDVKGQLISERRLEGQGTLQWSTIHLPNGIYYYQIQTTAGNPITHKIIIIH